MTTTPELSDIFAQYGQAYKRRYKTSIPVQHKKVMDVITACRTPVLGGQLFTCAHCGHQHSVYFSCRNRHCPKCQALPTHRWVEKRKQDLLPIPYFHVVFTLPEQLKTLTLNNQVTLYNILFNAASQTLKDLGDDPRYLGANIGVLAVLHTWSQTLAYHPHLHCIVTGGGLAHNRQRWIASKPDFLFPVKVMSKLFRGKFLYALKQAQQQGILKRPQNTSHTDFQVLMDTLYEKDWIVYCKPPFNGPKHVIAYLAQYTHRVAIANRRILKVENDKVCFSYRDRKDNDKIKTMALPVLTFIQRFLHHVLPKSFVKIRYFGILSNKHRKPLLSLCRKLLCMHTPAPLPTSDTSYLTLLTSLTGTDPRQCPRCMAGRLRLVGLLKPAPMRAPPPSACAA